MDWLNILMVRALCCHFWILANCEPRSLGTPATTSQMAKDVTTFLNWAAEPEHDERKKIGLQAVIIFSILTTLALYTKRFKWTPLKTRKIRECHAGLLYAATAHSWLHSLQPTKGYSALKLRHFLVISVEADELDSLRNAKLFSSLPTLRS